MEKRSLFLMLTCLCLMAVLTGCFHPTRENSDRMEASVDFGHEFDGSMIIIGGENGIIGQYPNEDWGEIEDPEWVEPTEPPEILVELPDGTKVPEENIQKWEDGTIVAFNGTTPTGHKCFFPDGTYAYTGYAREDGESCVYAEAATVYAEWFLKNGSDWKDERYSVKADGELFLESRMEYEYSPVEIGLENTPWYHSATNELFYDEGYGDYKTARSEYDPLHGSDCPIYCTYYDGSYSEHEYNLDGSRKKDSFYSANGNLTQADIYENGQMITQYLFREDGSRQFVTYYKDGEITSESFYSESGSYYETTYFKNGYRSYALGHYDDGRTSSTYYDEFGAVIKFQSNAPDGSLEWYALYENYADGSTKKVTYYDPDGQVTKVEQYDKDGNSIE